MDIISYSISVFFVLNGVEVWVARRQQRDLYLPALAAAVVGAPLAIAAGGVVAVGSRGYLGVRGR